MDNLKYWKKGESEQNFGDFLSEYIAKRLFLRTPRRQADVRIIGSFLHDWFVPEPSPTGPEDEKRLIAWGGGVREMGGLSDAARKRVEILSVRGPVSVSELALGADTPIGDPALLMPVLYKPRIRNRFRNQTICVPHFHDQRADDLLVSWTGCDVLLRPSIRPSDAAVENFVDAICSASFILCGSLHSAIVAAAYGRPFAFWDSGNIDLPLKWHDFAASINIPPEFVPNVAEGIAHFESFIKPQMQLPSMWEALSTAPYLLRPDALLKVLSQELDPTSAEAVEEKADAFIRRRDYADAIVSEAWQIITTLRQDNDSLREELSSERDALAVARMAAQDEAARMTERLVETELRLEAEVRQMGSVIRERDEARAEATRLQSDVAVHQRQEEEFVHERDEARAEVARLQSDVAVHQRQEAEFVHERDEVHASIARLRKEVEAEARQAAELVRERDEARAEVARLQSDVAVHQRREAEFVRERHEASAEVARLHSDVAVHQRREAEFVHERDEVHASIARLRKEVEAEARQAAELVHERDEARAEVARLHSDVAVHQSQEAEFVQERDEARAEVARLQSDVAVHQRQEAEFVHERDEARAEVARLVEEAAQQQAAAAAAQDSKRASHEPRILKSILKRPVVRGSAASDQAGDGHFGARMRRKSIRQISKSALFDQKWYRAVSGLDEMSRGELVAHYVEEGDARGLSPNPLFSPDFYRSAVPESGLPGVTALAHYLSSRARPHHKPHPLFDPLYYHNNNRQVPEKVDPLDHYLRKDWQHEPRVHPLFDGQFYLSSYPDVAAAAYPALLHYVELGWREGRKPHRLFDPAFYLTENPDVAESGKEPLSHYLTHGSSEGRSPNPLFDSKFYRNKYPDVVETGVDPLLHYETIGWREQRQPHPLFDVAFYLETYPEVAAKNVNPLADFLTDPASLGRTTHRLFDPNYYLDENPDVAEARANPLLHFLGIGWRKGRSPHPLFDLPYYVAHSPDVASTNALLHYIEHGWREGRKPHRLFDPAFYLSVNSDVAESGKEPLSHYLTYGSSEGRSPHPLFDSKHYRTEAQLLPDSNENALIHYLREGARRNVAPHPLFHAAGYATDQRDLSLFNSNALLHYLIEGAAEAVRPHPLFDPTLYESCYPDVAASGLPAFEHYVRFGQPERRRCSDFLKENETLEDAVLQLPNAADASITVIIPAYRSYGDTFRCLYSIATTADARRPARIVIADDCPSHPVGPHFQNVPNLEVITHPENMGFLRSCNRAAALTDSALIVFLNNDTVVRPNWLFHLSEPALRDPLVAMVGCKLLNEDGTLQEAGGIMFKNGWGYPYGRNDDPGKAEYNFVRQADCVIGACFLVRRKYFEEVNGFDDRYYPAFFEEFDLAMAFANSGYRVLYQPACEVLHIGSSSYGADVRDRQSTINHDRFAQKWERQLARQFDDEASLFLARDRKFPSGVILVIDDMVPEYDKHAGAVTLFQYLRLFTQLGFKVIYLPDDLRLRQPYTFRLQQLGIEVLYGDIDVHEWLIKNGSLIDYVWIARPDVANARLEDVTMLTNARILYYTHDLHFLRERRRYELDGNKWAKQESERLLPIEADIFNRVDCVMTPSSDEVSTIKQLAASVEVRVLTPYFFDETPSPRVDSLPIEQRREIIFVGGYAHTPNVDAAILLAQRIMPLVWRTIGDVKLLLVGSNPPPEVQNLAGPRVDVVGFVPDLAPWYARARMSVSPLRWGAGVKGKIVESLVAGVPVVTTPIGNEGIALEHRRQVLVGTTERELADHILALFRDEVLLRALAQAGSQVIASRFSERAARTQFLDAAGLAICNICGNRYAREAAVAIDWEGERNWREEPTCPACWALNRMNAVADVVLRPYREFACASVHEARPYMRELRIHEFGFVGPLHDQLKALPRFSCSDFFPDTPTGHEKMDGVLNEDLCALSFEDEIFDLTVSMEVLEHVPDPRAAFREIFRTLLPGGRHIMSVPYNPHAENSTTRCSILDGTLIHHLPAAYHGDPIRTEGALVFTDYGRDLIDMLQDTGFVVSVDETHHPDVRGGYVAVFDCLRPNVASGRPMVEI